ncbi:MAG: hypothetical protein M3068_12180 [Gemmatimonadota bacterium]|nr:hypothetical protein [Gemmatimonadota bacterium]
MLSLPGSENTAARPLAEGGDSLGADSPFDVLVGELDQVLSEWRALMRPEPWARLPSDRLLDSIPKILPELLRLAKTGVAHVDDNLKEQIAQEHGTVRREDNVPILALAEEWNAIKRACSEVLSRQGYGEETCSGVMARLELLVDDAVGYTLRGYYRPELDLLRGRGLERRDGSSERRSSGGSRRASPGD